MKVERAIARLAQILPLKTTFDALQANSASIYRAVLNGFYETGRAPLIRELEGIDSDAAQLVAELAGKDMLTLGASGEVNGCYPFSMEQRVHRIQLNGFEVHAMCALDALAAGAMFECPSLVLSECAITAQSVRVELNGQQVINKEQVSDLYFGMNWSAASSCGSCSESLCTEMLFLSDTVTAQKWLNEDAQNREIFTLAEAVEFSAGFFRPLMQQG